MTKTENGMEFPTSAFAYTPSNEPLTWKLRLWETLDTKETAKQIGMAAAALGPGFRGNKVEIPEADLAGVKAKVRAAWKKANPDKSVDEMPVSIKKADLATSEGDDVTLREKLWNFAKSMFGNPMGDSGEAKDLNTVLAEEAKDDILWKLTSAFRRSLDSILEDDTVTDKQVAISQVLQQFLTALATNGVTKAGRKISASRLDMLKQIQQTLMTLIAEAEANPDNNMNKRSDTKVVNEDIIKGLPKEVQNHIAELAKKAGEVDALNAKMSQLEKGEQKKEEPEDIWKSVHPEVRKQFEEMKKQAEDATIQALAAEKIAKAEREQRELTLLVKRCEAYDNVGKPEGIAAILKIAYGISDEHGKQVEETYRAAQERIAKGGLFSESGRSTAGFHDGGDAWSKIEALADGLVVKSGNMTKEQAVSKVLDTAEGRQLYVEYENQKGVK